MKHKITGVVYKCQIPTNQDVKDGARLIEWIPNSFYNKILFNVLPYRNKKNVYYRYCECQRQTVKSKLRLVKNNCSFVIVQIEVST